jgi:thiol:disulfide interchange protein DsbD
MRNFLLIFTAAFFLLSAVNRAHSEEVIPPSPIAKTELLVDAPSLEAGDVFWAAVKFTMPKNWHIYWQNPGDAGMPTTFAWTTPYNISAGEIQWPTPQRIEVSGLMNYGYSDEVMLAVPFKVTGDGITGRINTISVKANWLVCHETCIPESASLSAVVPRSDPAAMAQIVAARSQLPTVITDKNAATYSADNEAVSLRIDATKITPLDPQKPTYFFPQQDGIISNAAPQKNSFDAAKKILTITMKKGTAETVDVWQGVLVNGNHSYAISPALNAGSPIGAAASVTTVTEPPALGLLLTIAFALVGGLLLNIMPCVLPILSLKALTLVKKSAISPALARAHGVAYTAGVVGSFLLIATIMLGLRASGEAIGWGFQLQSPTVVFALFALMLAVSANLAGLFELPVLFGGVDTDHEKLRGSFLTGVLAVAVATPCTAPFMAGAIGATLLLPAAQSLLVFAVMGMGMAVPFLIISVWPKALAILPKPGAWMHRFKQILAIPMLLTALWLLTVFVQLLQMNPGTAMPMPSSYTLITPQPYSELRLNELRAQKTPVLVDATAAWCLSCKVNERVGLKPARTQKFLRDNGIALMIADWTSSDEAITRYLASFGRNGVPLYVFYPPEGEPIVLPQVLTPSIVIDALSPSFFATKSD